MKLKERNDSPLPLRPTNLRSLNLATWFFIRAVEFLSSAQQFSSLPARTVTRVPSPTSPRATTLKATGRVLLDLQCAGRTVQTKCGEPVNRHIHFTLSAKCLIYVLNVYILQLVVSFSNIFYKLDQVDDDCKDLFLLRVLSIISNFKSWLPVLTSSPGCSLTKSPRVLSARMSLVILV